MTWKEVYPNLIKYNEKRCLDFSLACFNLASIYTSNPYILNSVDLVKNGENKKELRNRLQEIGRIRRVTQEHKEKEAAHIVLHLVETAISTNNISAAGHTSRSVEALFRIDKELGNEVLKLIG